MKKIILFITLCTLCISCEIKEELYITKRGKGELNFKADFGRMLSFVNSMPKNTEATAKTNKKIDTIFHFDELFEKMKDSISKLSKEDQDLIEKMKTYSMQMTVDFNNSKGLFALSTTFDDVDEINNFPEILNKASSFNKKTKKMASPEKYGFRYELNRKKFKRFVTEKKLSEEEEQKYQNQIKTSKMILSGSNYTLLYHFDKKIKSISNKDAVLTPDKKTLEITYPMDTLILNPYLLEFEVTFK